MDKIIKPFFIIGSIFCMLTVLNWWIFSSINFTQMFGLSYRILYFTGIYLCYAICCVLNFINSKDYPKYDQLFLKNMITLNFGLIVFVIFSSFEGLKLDLLSLLYIGFIANALLSIPNIINTLLILFVHRKLKGKDAQKINK